MVTQTMPCRSSHPRTARPDVHASVENNSGWDTERNPPSSS